MVAENKLLAEEERAFSILAAEEILERCDDETRTGWDFEARKRFTGRDFFFFYDVFLAVFDELLVVGVGWALEAETYVVFMQGFPS